MLVAEKENADFFEEVATGRDPKLASNWVTQELFGSLNKTGASIAGSPVSAKHLGTLIDLIEDGTISRRIAKEVFDVMYESGGDPAQIVKDRGLEQLKDTSAIEAEIDKIIAANPDKVEQVKQKPKALGWFVGEVMKATSGKANPKSVNDILKSKLNVD